MKLRIQLNGAEYEIDANKQGDRILVTLGKTTHVLKVLASDGNSLRLDHNGRQLHVAGIKQELKRQLSVNGRLTNYERVSDDPAAQDGSAGSLSSSIPAVVAEILVSVGDEVTAGDRLILLESMKMIIPIQSTTDGTVTALYCTTGDSVQAGVPLISVD